MTRITGSGRVSAGASCSICPASSSLSPSSPSTASASPIPGPWSRHSRFRVRKTIQSLCRKVFQPIYFFNLKRLTMQSLTRRAGGRGTRGTRAATCRSTPTPGPRPRYRSGAGSVYISRCGVAGGGESGQVPGYRPGQLGQGDHAAPQIHIKPAAPGKTRITKMVTKNL